MDNNMSFEYRTRASKLLFSAQGYFKVACDARSHLQPVVRPVVVVCPVLSELVLERLEGAVQLGRVLPVEVEEVLGGLHCKVYLSVADMYIRVYWPRK